MLGGRDGKAGERAQGVPGAKGACCSYHVARKGFLIR